MCPDRHSAMVLQRRLAFGVVTVEGKEITIEGVFQVLVPGGTHIWHQDGQRFPLYIQSNTTYFKVKNVQAIPWKRPAVRGDDQEAWEQAGQDETPAHRAALKSRMLLPRRSRRPQGPGWTGTSLDVDASGESRA